MKKPSRSDKIQNILLVRIFNEILNYGRLSRRELKERIKYETLDYGEDNEFAKETPDGWPEPRCYNYASWVISSSEVAGFLEKHGGRGGVFELTPLGLQQIDVPAETIRESIEAAWNHHMAQKAQKKEEIPPPPQYVYNVYHHDVVDTHERAWVMMHQGNRNLTKDDPRCSIANSGIHQLSKNQFIAYSILRIRMG